MTFKADKDRYERQRILPEIGAAGQKKLGAASVLIVGCGALGSRQAELLARAGVGRLRLVDRDFLEQGNLQRQALFDEEDAALSMPKAEAAARKLHRINSEVKVEGVVAHFNPLNAEIYADGMDLVLDGTDNLETRYLVNDLCVKLKKPWIYGGVLAMEGLVLAVQPGEGPCLRCLYPEPPPPGALASCETRGILNTAPALVASIQVTEAIRRIVEDSFEPRGLLRADLWAGIFQRIRSVRDPACPCCGQGRFDFLEGTAFSKSLVLCGRYAVQISLGRRFSDSALVALSKELEKTGSVFYNRYLLRFETEEHELALFPDGRVIVKGTSDPDQARSLCARYLGC